MAFIGLTILSLSPFIGCLCLNRLRSSTPPESTDCPTLCSDGLPITAITGIEGTPKLLIVSGECAFVVDPTRDGTDQIRHGFRHSMAFQDIQDMFAVKDTAEDIEFVSLYVSINPWKQWLCPSVVNNRLNYGSHLIGFGNCSRDYRY
jgi:hypothetical protein